MGEYAKYNGELVKIGTCEDMYYLRADQVGLVAPQPNSVDPVLQAEGLRFRFPFPHEDGIEPGAFENYSLGIPVHALSVPEGVEHSTLQFCSQNHFNVSLPCPYSPEASAQPYRVHSNGAGNHQIEIVQQRLIGGHLVLVCRCAGCGAKWRYDTLEEARPVIDALRKEAEKQHFFAKHDMPVYGFSGDTLDECARRIEAGYTQPTWWDRALSVAA